MISPSNVTGVIRRVLIKTFLPGTHSLPYIFYFIKVHSRAKKMIKGYILLANPL